MALHASWLGDDQPSLHGLSGHTSDKEPYVVACLSKGHLFVEGLDAHNLRFHVFVIAIEFNLIADVHFASLDSPARHCSSALHCVG